MPGSDFERAGAAILRPEAFVRDRCILETLGAAISREELYGSLTLASVRFAQAAAILDSGCGRCHPGRRDALSRLSVPQDTSTRLLSLCPRKPTLLGLHSSHCCRGEPVNAPPLVGALLNNPPLGALARLRPAISSPYYV